MRVGELLSLRISDVKTEGGEVDVIVVGKTGQRTVSLLNPTYLLTYLKQMRNHTAPTAPLFVKLQNGTATEEWLSYEAIKKKLRDIKERVPELKGRRVYPHLFRHSFASFLAGQNFNPEIMRRYFGWASNQMASTYVHLNDQVVKDAIRTLGKREVKPIEPRLVPKKCWRCGFDNEPTDDLCKRCFVKLDKNEVLASSIKKNDEAAILKSELDAVKQKMDDMTRAINLLMEKVEPQTRDEILGILKNER